MSVAMQSPATGYPESTLESEDAVYPCKGCGEILEEGKAFELAGNRWHIDCFRCNTCQTLLDSDANLLLLGDGSLICNNCTYSCSACNNKIEDLAILTGDQAFCSSCFRCRNCKNKIENLRYARTTQGIFCMSCYESLTQRRRKNRNKQKTGDKLNKALPEPPRPNLANNSGFPSNSSDTPTERLSEAETRYSAGTSSRTMPNNSRPDMSSSREMSSSTLDGIRGSQFTLPASTYEGITPTSPTPGMTATISDPLNDLADGLFVPLVLDPIPSASASPLVHGNDFSDTSKASEETKSHLRDHLIAGSTQSRPTRDYLRESQRESRSSSTERKAGASPHIAYQEKSRERGSTDHIADVVRKRGPSATTSPRVSESQSTSSPYSATPQNEFRLQEAPKSKKPPSRGSSGDTRSAVTSPSDGNSRNITPQMDMPIGLLESEPEHLRHSSASDGHVDRSPNGIRRDGLTSRPRRGDSLGNSSAVSRKEIPSTSGSILQNIAEFGHERKVSTNSLRHNLDTNGSMVISRPIESPGNAKSMYDTSVSASGPGSGSGQGSRGNSEAFAAPRHAPPVPPYGHRPTPSNGTGQSDRESASPTYGENGDSYEGVLRKMSNAMRGHARSVSDKVIPSPRSAKHPWPKSPMNGGGSVDLTTPTSPESREEFILLRSQLRRAQQRITDLETEKTNLQGIVNNDPEIRSVNTALREKRSTMAVLDTQREVVARELEVMTDHLKQMKDSTKPFDMNSFKSEVLNDFQQSMKRLKESLGSEVEGLIQKRNDLNVEITTLIQMKDKGFQEYENLSNRNAQLNQHNNELHQNIQNSMKQSSNPQTNGLGLYMGNGSQPTSQIRLDSGNDLKQMMLDSNTTLNLDNDQDSAIITTPHVVKMKQQKPNMLRKGGFLKGIKGMKGALMSDRPAQSATYPTEGTPYSNLQDTSGGAPRTGNETKNKFGGFFGHDRNGMKHLRTMNNGSSTNLAGEQPSANQLFGTDLSVRSQFEAKDIPAIVIRCVQEVELRGMDVEGIYRKSGGSGQVNVVKAGFEKDDDYDISDPELEIHAVTSTLKQYFRRLPTPLITFDVYDYFLEAARIEEVGERAVRLREAVNRLPKAHKDCLEFLIFHLARVTNHERDNLMTPLNLAVVFAPTIMRPSTIEREMMDMGIQRQTVQSLLELNKQVFETEV